ncbi:helix-turn-helix domain-containing protein [Bordetella sp. H567]|uniref:helix-turn-helix domain-containing protein n=1 Tax=Bordetella sp. H567 TaxID=1697043 RepID=UPI00082DA698|nr:AraC family transcriptional regulator [Bordetella sp. H567]
MNSAPTSHTQSYADYYRSIYPFTQEHRSAGGLKLFRAPCHVAGDYVESAHGISLQISCAPRAGGWSRIDLGAGRFNADLSAANYLVAPPDHACTYELGADIDLLVVEFSSKAFWGHPWRLQDQASLHHGARYDPLPIKLAEKIWELSAHGLTQLEADSLAMALATLLARAAQPAPGIKPLKGGLAPKELKRLTDYMKAHLATDLSLADLAGLVSRSPYHFARAFKTSMGLPPHRYVMLLRVQQAQSLLVAGPLSVAHVAHACGFASSQHMATAFRRMIGTTPTEYRRQHAS